MVTIQTKKEKMHVIRTIIFGTTKDI